MGSRKILSCFKIAIFPDYVKQILRNENVLFVALQYN